MRLALLLASLACLAADWPQWRGTHRDGVVRGVKAPDTWPKTLREEWKTPVGEGVASPVLVGDKVFVFIRQKEEESVVCLDAAGGKVLWRSEPYPALYNWGPGEGDFSKGPRSTPSIVGDRIYTLGMSDVLSCLDARSGRLLWRKECKPPTWQGHNYSGASPLVADGLCIVNVGDGKKPGLAAFDALSGETKWLHADGSVPMSDSPILVDVAGERLVVVSTLWDFLGVSAASGKQLWKHKASFGAGTRCVTPLVHKDLLILTDYGEAPRALKLEKISQGIVAHEVWAASGLPHYFATPVISGDLLFGMSTKKVGCFYCLDATTGQTLWESDGRHGDNASLLSVGNVVLILTSNGKLHVVKASRTFERLAEYQVSDSRTYAHPVFLGDRILIKDATTLRSLTFD